MNSLTQILFWCPVQVTVLALAALAIGAIAGRRRPAAGALVAAAALLAVVGLTATALAPWPAWTISWDRLPWTHAIAANEAKTEGLTSPAATNFPTRELDNEQGYERPIVSQSTTVPSRAEISPDKTWAAISGNWITLAAVLYLVGVGVMMLRIALGLVAVRGYRRHSHPITDRKLGELADVVCAQLGCRAGIELRESTRIGTPATIGWLRPMILLPADWRGWTEGERHAVLAHEVEHVRRRDFASWMAAQIGVALHFYHPLVHWLANRLRLQQELAADAAAARLVGGQRKYVTTLAAMALRRADQPLAWPASAFIPNAKTFVRRIEMLHRSKPLRGDVSRPIVFLSVAAVVLAAVCAAGIRGSIAADEPAAGGNAAPPVVAFNQADPPAKNPLEEQRHALEDRRKIVQDFNNLKQLSLAMHVYHDKNRHFPLAAPLGPDGKTPHSWRVELLPELDQQALYDQYRMDEPWDSENNKKVLAHMPEVFRSPFDDPKSTNSGYYVLVGPGTVFEGPQGIRVRDIVDGTSNTLLIVEAKRNVPWTKPEDIPFDAQKPLPELVGFVKGQFVAAMCDGSVHTFNIEKAKDLLKWLIMRNDGHTIEIQQLFPERRPGDSGTEESRRLLRGALMVHEVNDLKQLALAMHNYHDKNAHFPPAAPLGPDGKTPHSWRVELLPFLDQLALYNQYRMNEPWDSENNRKVLARIPDVFRSPFDDPKSTNSGYYVLVGPGTVFEGPQGVRIADIIDGTSNTLMIVEAKRNIPWTKPEDIPFDPQKPLPELGGFVQGQFRGALADGSVRGYILDKVKDQLKWLIMRNDMNVIDVERL
ncbi:MAG TPA: M56 family metallopeptidase, partial [Planctomycetaceae bacterium]|nr:M56 family metallopeptidase [Planctomycetaceae bacterium]